MQCCSFEFTLCLTAVPVPAQRLWGQAPICCKASLRAALLLVPSFAACNLASGCFWHTRRGAQGSAQHAPHKQVIPYRVRAGCSVRGSSWAEPAQGRDSILSCLSLSHEFPLRQVQHAHDVVTRVLEGLLPAAPVAPPAEGIGLAQPKEVVKPPPRERPPGRRARQQEVRHALCCLAKCCALAVLVAHWPSQAPTNAVVRVARVAAEARSRGRFKGFRCI